MLPWFNDRFPLYLAPMAGITNTAFRRLCREHGGGLFISEMITSRALVERVSVGAVATQMAL